MSAPCRIGGLGETIAGIVHAVVVASGASSLITSAWIRLVRDALLDAELLCSVQFSVRLCCRPIGATHGVVVRLREGGPVKFSTFVRLQRVPLSTAFSCLLKGLYSTQA